MFLIFKHCCLFGLSFKNGISPNCELVFKTKSKAEIQGLKTQSRESEIRTLVSLNLQDSELWVSPDDP